MSMDFLNAKANKMRLLEEGKLDYRNLFTNTDQNFTELRFLK